MPHFECVLINKRPPSEKRLILLKRPSSNIKTLERHQIHLASLTAHIRNAALQKQWSSSEFVNYYVYVSE